jgi:hypothetical protein
VLIDRDGELDLFDGDDLLLLARGTVTLIFFVEKLAVVLNLADRRDGIRGDLYKIQRTLTGHLEGFKGGHNAKLFAIFIDDADFTGADTFIGADKRLRRTFINWGNKSPPQRVLSLV